MRDGGSSELSKLRPWRPAWVVTGLGEAGAAEKWCKERGRGGRRWHGGQGSGR